MSIHDLPFNLLHISNAPSEGIGKDMKLAFFSLHKWVYILDIGNMTFFLYAQIDIGELDFEEMEYLTFNERNMCTFSVTCFGILTLLNKNEF